MSDRGRHTGDAVGSVWRPTKAAAVVALTCAAIGVGSLAYATHDEGGGPQAPAGVGRTRSDAPSVQPEQTAPAHSRGPLMTRSVPMQVAVPSVNIDTSLLRLGLNADGSLQVPWKPLLAGWYTGSPTPGQLGPAIIAGHVDSWATGPAVFYRLGEVAVGAHVLVTRADASVADFRVTAVTSYPKAAFPTHRVYGDVNRAELRLITCAKWNSNTQEYDNNIVVFAKLIRT
jgi:sortase (surface protein transpeptidase)